MTGGCWPSSPCHSERSEESGAGGVRFLPSVEMTTFLSFHLALSFRAQRGIWLPASAFRNRWGLKYGMKYA